MVLEGVLYNHGLLKRELLIWQGIAIPHLDFWIDYYHKKAKDENAQGARDLLYLYEKGIIYNVDVDFSIIEENDIKGALTAMGDIFGVPIDKKEYYLNLKSKRPSIKEIRKGEKDFNDWHNVVARLGALCAKHDSESAEIFPLLSGSVKSWGNLKGKEQDIATLVINKLPVPNEITPYEEIFDYRKDEESKQHFEALRLWMQKLEIQGKTVMEIQQELDFLLHEYEKHLKLHRIRFRHETLKLVVKAVPSLMENLIKLRLSKLMDTVFDYKENKLKFMEAELENPGLEIAYVYKTKEKYSK